MTHVVVHGTEPNALVQRIVEGDRSAEAELIALVARPIRLLAHARTGDPDLARDLAQDSLIEVLVALRNGRLRSSDALIPFVLGVARNVVNSWARTRFRELRAEPLDVDFDIVSAASGAGALDRDLQVRQAVGKLAAIDQQILHHALIDGMDAAETAAALELSADNVRQRKSRALRKLADLLGREPSVRNGGQKE